ncbi:uncharacterized protein LOC126738130 [Anthonomus grandis grandis]|uniref:uncharacterized protein LOC126738130 n=1 Tax=Anthonomus grandis grandis TaxID=2921223 RepID=UPI0021662AFD|nr:uncharacterized protein LOC126738130 [Anthonomus grandis grandis]
MIFPRKKMKDELFLNAPTGTCKMISHSGFINKELFCQWLRHFKSYSKPSAENQVGKFCRDNYIDLLSLPPHASHRMQPLDVGFFGPLKCAYNRECDKWMVSNPGKVIMQMQVAGLFNQAYTSVANIGKSENSFRASGIYPYNPDQFNDDNFAPSCVTDAPFNTPDAPNYTENAQLNDEVVVEIDDPDPSTSIPIHATPPDIVCEDGVLILKNSSTFEEEALNRSISASKILPLPQIKEKPNRSRSRSQKSETLCSIPFKDELQELAGIKKGKEEKEIEAAKRKLVVTGSKPQKTKKVKKKISKGVEKEAQDVENCTQNYLKMMT